MSDNLAAQTNYPERCSGLVECTRLARTGRRPADPPGRQPPARFSRIDDHLVPERTRRNRARAGKHRSRLCDQSRFK
jgi:hypothetical protein